MRPDVVFPLLIVAFLIVAPIAVFVFTRQRAKTGSTLAKTLCWSLRIASLFPWLCVILLLAWFAATSRDYNPDVTQWIEVQRPTEPAEHALWFFAADYSDVQWLVARHGDKVRAHLVGWREALKWLLLRQPFIPRVDQFSTYRAFHVRDGWLIGFNDGEFGAALYWFSNNGTRNYKISDDQVVDFLSTPQGVIAIQGLAHMGVSYGSLIRITQDAKTGRWRSIEIKGLPEAPESFVRLDDGRIFLALSNSLAVVTSDNQLETLITSTDWVRPDTIAASVDASKIYVGTLQYVCEYDVQTKRFRYLVPSMSFVNKLSKDQEDDIRKSYRN